MVDGSLLLERVEELCRFASTQFAGDPAAEEANAAAERLRGPLRVAIAGRVKAGKSTLLNALLGERLAPTDAGECTRIVTWFRYGSDYDVQAVLGEGGRVPLRFRHDSNALAIEIGDLPSKEIERIEVSWPSARLKQLTLIDTPGLGSLDDEVSQHTRGFFGFEDDRPGGADAVIYLMRHAHRSDVDFLESFLDRSVTNASPVNAVAVLSRADDIGAGRPDALASAAVVAARYAADPRLRNLAATVIPVAGLLAETGATLQEGEFAALRSLAALDATSLDALLLSVDRVCEAGVTSLTIETRRELIARLGLFGLRLALSSLQAGRVRTATDLSRLLTDASGVTALRELLDGHFAARAGRLKARAALSTLRALANDSRERMPVAAAAVAAAIEELEAKAHELAEMRLLHLVMTGEVRFSAAERSEAARLIGESAAAARLGRPLSDSASELGAAAMIAIERWRDRATNPLTDLATSQACEILIRSYEGIYAEIATARA